jgi:bacillithiol biosynthesis cysteine-adding enzyme BshC
MDCTATRISYKNSGYFTPIVIDYIDGKESLKSFYQHPVSIKGVEQAIHERNKFPTNRALLVEQLRLQYTGLTLSDKQESHLKALLSENSFTICTAHQPNIFTGPLYFIYKIVHAIRMADDLSKQLPDYQFIPVFYMGSEDADLDELGSINLGDNKLIWHTKQSGAVGRMKVDKSFLHLIDAVAGQVLVHPYGQELIDIFCAAYSEGKTIQQATLELVHALFAEYGLLVLIPDNAQLKRVFSSIVKKELTEQFSAKTVQPVIEELSKQYKVQAAGREINLFYLIDDKRERISFQDSKFKIENTKLIFTKEEILEEVEVHPERFSTNVILRGLFQEMILPNIAFIGGGAEIAYWLELKTLFERSSVPFPMLLLRNSFWWLDKKGAALIAKLGFKPEDFFAHDDTLINKLVLRESKHETKLNGAFEQAEFFYEALKAKAADVDITLTEHIDALKTKAIHRLKELEKKILRAEKRKYHDQERQIKRIRHQYFPYGGLQERFDNISLYYARYGKAFIKTLYNYSPVFEQVFTIIQEL